MPTKNETSVVPRVYNSNDGPTMPMWLKVLLVASAICFVGFQVRSELKTNPYYNYTSEQFAYAEQMRTNIRSGGYITGAIVELRNGKIGFISWADADHSNIRIVFPRGEEVYMNVRTRKDEPMYNILSITRASDPNYPSMREKILPVRKQTN